MPGLAAFDLVDKLRFDGPMDMSCFTAFGYVIGILIPKQKPVEMRFSQAARNCTACVVIQ
jgi:hypothetical protein